MTFTEKRVLRGFFGFRLNPLVEKRSGRISPGAKPGPKYDYTP
jgi:hypothetical protein